MGEQVKNFHLMKGREFIEQCLGHKLQGGIVQSFYLKQELEDEINVTFLRFNNRWIKITSTDENTNVNLENNNIERIPFYGDDEFKYPLKPIANIFPEFNKYLNKKLLSFKELVLKNSEFMSFGLSLYFEDNLCFIIRKHDYPLDKNEYIFEKTEFEGLREK